MNGTTCSQDGKPKNDHNSDAAARKRGNRMYWIVALLGLACLGTGLVLLVTRLVSSSARDKDDSTAPAVLPEKEKDESPYEKPPENNKDDHVMSTPTIPAEVSSATIPLEEPLCTQVSYQLNFNHWTASDAKNNGLPQGLEVAATRVIQEFCDTWDHNDHGTLVEYSSVYPATVNSIVDLPATLCQTVDGNSQTNNADSSCLLVQQIACVMVSHHASPGEPLGSAPKATVEVSLQQALRDSIASGTLIANIPPNFL
jgi:hypothetical protein